MKKEDYLKKINNIPFWVKTEEDYKKLICHLYHRLEQAKQENNFLSEQIKKYLSTTVAEGIFLQSDVIRSKLESFYTNP